MEALKHQVGGDHYRSLAYQPVELCVDVKASPVLNHFTKYLVRDKGERTEQVQKALHCIELERDMVMAGRTQPTGIRETSQTVFNKLDEFSSQFTHPLLIKTAILFFIVGAYDSCRQLIEDNFMKIVEVRKNTVENTNS